MNKVSYSPSFRQIERQLALYAKDYNGVPDIKDVKSAIFRNNNDTIFALKGGPRSGWYEDDVLVTVNKGDKILRILISKKVC